MWRPFLISATLGLTIPSSATYSSSLLLNTSFAFAPFNNTRPAQKTLGETANPKYSPWPRSPYSILLSRDLELYIPYASVRTSPMISVPELCHFLQDFADNIQRDHPVPGFVPRHATQSTINISSYTRWIINVSEGPWLGRLPTAVLLAVLNELAKLLRLHGPSSVIWGIKVDRRYSVLAFGDLDIEQIVSVSFNESSSDDNEVFQTA